MSRRSLLMVAGLVLSLQACAGPQKPPEDLLSPSEAQMKLRSFQTRTFDVKDSNTALRGVVAALQDLGFIIERANAPMGLVTAGKFAGEGFSGFVEVTVIVRNTGTNQTEVRINALFNKKPIDDPKVYQNFFATLERSLFVTH
ncbi:MAG TPA: hypothetical protein VLY45_05640 [Nitrospiria bacterium]|nr:hypothetical protein [Nitrospiria bacterium]